MYTNRGSEWNIWDLHIHTPETAKNNQYGDAEKAWPKFIAISASIFGAAVVAFSM